MKINQKLLLMYTLFKKLVRLFVFEMIALSVSVCAFWALATIITSFHEPPPLGEKDLGAGITGAGCGAVVFFLCFPFALWVRSCVWDFMRFFYYEKGNEKK